MKDLIKISTYTLKLFDIDQVRNDSTITVIGA